MFYSILAKTRELKRSLTRLDDQPLGKAALTVVVFLDLFILISIFDGLADHTAQLATPEQYVPRHCRDIVISADWNPTNRFERLAQIVTTYRGSYYAPSEREQNREEHVLCEPISRIFRFIEKDETLSKNLAELARLRRESGELRSELERIKGAYDTSLLESIAAQRQGEAKVASIKKEIAQKTETLDELVRRSRLLESALEQDQHVRDLFALIAGISDADRLMLRDDLRSLHFWFPVKRLGMEMIFLLPLFLVFYFWNSRSIARSRPFQTLVSSHLVVLVFIPVFFKILELIYDIIPKKLLKHIFELLESLKLVAVWHYLLMGIGILIALVLIYLFQKKLFSREKLIEKRIAKGSCQNCGRRLPPDCRACPFCGFQQYRSCRHCHKPTHVHAKYCIECGGSD